MLSFPPIVISSAPLELGLPLAIGALVAFLVVTTVTRRRNAMYELRTICPRCGAAFQARARVDFLGFREMTCSACGATGPYPLSKPMVVTYVVLFVGACTAIGVQILTDPKWQPRIGSIWVLLLPFVLVQNHRMWRRLRELSASGAEPVVPMQRVMPAQPRRG